MKNLMLAAVMCLGTITAIAHGASGLDDASITVAETQDDFNEVALTDVPEAITAALEIAHPGASITKAYVNEQSQYKLEVTTEDGQQVELFSDAQGNWLNL
ncbi:MAG: hypothetical protein AAFX53_16690 [Bacteroidota bacterium]